MLCVCVWFFVFFQAEDGIRDKLVTGVQTCALPISDAVRRSPPPRSSPAERTRRRTEIGRASCRERVEISVVAVSLKKKRDNLAGRTVGVARTSSGQVRIYC